MPKLININTADGKPFMLAGIKFFPGVPVTLNDAAYAVILSKRKNLAETPLRDPADIPAVSETVTLPAPAVEIPALTNPTEQAVAAAQFQRPRRGRRPKAGTGGQ